MDAFVIRAYRRRFVGPSRTPPDGATVSAARGWRPFRFVDRLDEAETFASIGAAMAFLHNLHRADHFAVVNVLTGAPVA